MAGEQQTQHKSARLNNDSNRDPMVLMSGIRPLAGGSGRLVHELVGAQVSRAPERVALSLGAESLTYAGLWARARVIAGQLGERGVRGGDLVGVFLERSFDLVASFLGVLQAGAAYVPLDTNYPAERLGLMAKDTGMKVILSVGSLKDRLPKGASPILDLEQVEGVSAEGFVRGTCSQQVADSGEQLAYVMYTSGSTGVPKGVAIPHRGIVRLVWEPDYVRISPEDVFVQMSPVSFDASTLEIWGALANGARLVLMPPPQPSLEEIGEVIRREGESVLWLTAGLFNLMVDERLGDLVPVKQLLVGGDVLSVRHVRRALQGLPSTQLINGYGPTENTTFTCCYSIPRDLPGEGSVPIGRPIRGTTVHVVDENLREVPRGNPGELLAGGLGLAVSYWNRPELTAERFVDAAFDGEREGRFYRTGDRVRWRADGVLEFLGREDNQVKLRGFRIEPGEIESTLRRHGDVRDCAVTVCADALGNRSLAAWVVPKGTAAIQEADLRAYAAKCLPPHMVPVFWSCLDKLPLNANGKLDRGQLPQAAGQGARAQSEPPSNALERLLAQLFEQLLGGRSVGLTESFFELGMSSLLLAQAHERLRREHGFRIQLTDLFRFTTIRQLAHHLQGQEQASAESQEPGRQRARLRAAALSRLNKR